MHSSSIVCGGLVMLTVLFFAQALTGYDLRQDRFYVAGIQQGMTLQEFNSLISNGGYRSEPLGPDKFVAHVGKQRITVEFCRGAVVSAMANYLSSDWMRSIQILQTAGVNFGEPVLDIQNDELSSGMISFSVGMPKGFRWFAMPTVKGMKYRGNDMPIFQIDYEAIDNPCSERVRK